MDLATSHLNGASGLYPTSPIADVVDEQVHAELSRRQKAAIGSRRVQVVWREQYGKFRLRLVRRRLLGIRGSAGFDPHRPYQDFHIRKNLAKNLVINCYIVTIGPEPAQRAERQYLRERTSRLSEVIVVLR